MSTTATTTSQSRGAGAVCERMTRTVRRGPRPRAWQKPASPYVRVAREFNWSDKTARNRIPQLYKWVARCNWIFREAGQTDYVVEHMVDIDASMAGRQCRSLTEALHRAELADADEQRADEQLREAIRTGTVTVADCEEFLRRNAHAIRTAEECQVWVTELRDALRGGQ